MILATMFFSVITRWGFELIIEGVKLIGLEKLRPQNSLFGML